MTAHFSAPSANEYASSAGENPLLDRAVLAYYDELCGSVRRRGHSPANSQEIVHDVYVRLRQRHSALENKTSLRAFLIRACINLGIDRFRRERFESCLFSGSEQEALQVSAPIASPDQTLDLEHRIGILKVAIMEMSLQRRRVFIASRVGKLPADEIAERMKISRNMVDRHLRKAYLHCLDRLEDTL
ncbi:RNA polymerase sigma factor [Aliirhizobium smilacinae]|uniref:Sigma-70 family RNA polymerase sigma factor n=1 Tax=Aliirhizobium smilacinae TaxID=1395944 RepID=A0A5C4XKL7_9HYPH|nr:sigma-70 family RNA polymerase sigma factor [Rhizobium smilacinae]TNM63024.1 sigma-70 family RNA polymerase sigma factor [Rhizobium smilacinae]